MIFILLFRLSMALAAPSPEDWTTHALRLSGESDKIRENAVQALKETPEIETLLRRELLGPKRYLALDSIAALRIETFLPDLFALTENDDNGAVYLAINTFLGTPSEKAIIAMYRSRVRGHKELSMPAKVVLLDTLGRMGEVLTERELRPFLQSKRHEVRNATLTYLRYMVVKGHAPDRLAWVAPFLRHEPYQIRLQAIYLVRDVPASLKQEGRKILQRCLEDEKPEVKAACVSSLEALR